MSVSKEELLKDSRFYIDSRNLDRLTHRRILRYDIKKKKVGMILREVPDSSQIVTLNKTSVYAYLSGTKEGEKDYDKYVKLCNVSFRNREAYDKLIDDMSKNPYDITKGAIVVNQDDIIYDGQHRCCYLLYNFGPNYKIDVLKLTYENSSVKISDYLYRLKLIIAKSRAFLLCLFN